MILYFNFEGVNVSAEKMVNRLIEQRKKCSKPMLKKKENIHENRKTY